MTADRSKVIGRAVDEAYELRRVMARRSGAHACLWLLLAGAAIAALVFHLIGDAGRGPMFAAIVFCSGRVGEYLGSYAGWAEGFRHGVRWKEKYPNGRI